MRHSYFRFVVLVFLCICASICVSIPALAQENPASDKFLNQLIGETERFDITNKIQTLYDTAGKLTFEQVCSSAYQNKFKHESKLIAAAKNHWYKIELDNQTATNTFYLDVSNGMHTELYLIQGEKLMHYANGIYTPLKERSYLGGFAQYILTLGKGKTSIYVVSKGINTCDVCIGEKRFVLYAHQGYFHRFMNGQLLSFMVIGILLALAFYNIFLYFMVKDKAYLYYVASVFFVGGYFFFLQHYPKTWFDVSSDTLRYLPLQISNFCGCMAIIFFAGFSQIYLSSKIYYPKIHKFLDIMKWLITASFILIVITDWNYSLFYLNRYTLILNNLNIASVCVALILLSIFAWRSDNFSIKYVARYYVVANSILLIAVIFYMGGSAVFQLYSETFLSRYAIQIGMTIQMITFSIALAARINLLKVAISAKEIAHERLERDITQQKNIELEQKVQERTKSLQQSNEEIRTQSEEIEKQARLLDDQKNRQLINKTLQVLQKNELLPEVSKFLESINGELSGDIKKESKEWQKKLTQSLQMDTHWEEMKAHFEEVHPNLFATLYSKCADLSSNDLRHCAYQKMGLNKKEIAQLLSIEPESVRKHQYRIKKRLQLEEDVSFADFITSIH